MDRAEELKKIVSQRKSSVTTSPTTMQTQSNTTTIAQKSPISHLPSNSTPSPQHQFQLRSSGTQSVSPASTNTTAQSTASTPKNSTSQQSPTSINQTSMRTSQSSFSLRNSGQNTIVPVFPQTSPIESPLIKELEAEKKMLMEKYMKLKQEQEIIENRAVQCAKQKYDLELEMRKLATEKEELLLS